MDIREKWGQGFPRYVILGACHPSSVVPKDEFIPIDREWIAAFPVVDSDQLVRLE